MTLQLTSTAGDDHVVTGSAGATPPRADGPRPASAPETASPGLSLIARPRRLRRTEPIRRLVRETELTVARLIQPWFVTADPASVGPIDGLPGIRRFGLDRDLETEAMRTAEAGLGGILLFGIPSSKDVRASDAFAATGIVQEAIRRIKAAAPDLLVLTDVCCCEYTDHGHCGIIRNGEVDNDATLALLATIAVSHVAAGADIVAPSASMDGMVASIRAGLDAAGFTDRAILSYSAKHASAFYGPFRVAAESAPAFGDRRSYQLDPANRRDALREAALDEAEGADLLMVKPALPALDIIQAIRHASRLPLVAYQVSGEYAMLKAAARHGWLDERAAVLEALGAIRRAGADAIITYYATEAAAWISH